jgi:hypothetical protein
LFGHNGIDREDFAVFLLRREKSGIELFFYSFIHIYIHCLGHFYPLPPAPTLSFPTPFTSR